MLTLKTEKFTKLLTDIMDAEQFAVLAVAPVYAYVDGKKTETVIATKYTVANSETFVNFDVKVNQTVPVVTQEQIDASDERFWVSFTNAVVRPYKVEFGNVLCSVTADSVVLDNGK